MLAEMYLTIIYLVAYLLGFNNKIYNCINLVANNFNLESSNSSSVLPYRLNYLQCNFPCNRGSGICLQNGKYTMTLQFAELTNLTTRWVRRVFDIYLQVSENYMEIHLFWAGKGTCCILDIGTYGPSISAISATPVLVGLDVRPYTFNYVELKTAIKGFSSANKLGEGGYGLVYKVFALLFVLD
ncbi:hypothetical protein Patl1_24204 [Pistacia atlantica]|uniref:Uncharacterized protein n=1 Tax=Pistacia atlantica TaxID=434234 RepID=A0ACC1A002_9ROSI|nr:hypothetical protein Patl1_24204 [Pistacia atlantica]